jgi:hypothetical protein
MQSKQPKKTDQPIRNRTAFDVSDASSDSLMWRMSATNITTTNANPPSIIKTKQPEKGRSVIFHSNQQASREYCIRTQTQLVINMSNHAIAYRCTCRDSAMCPAWACASCMKSSINLYESIHKKRCYSPQMHQRFESIDFDISAKHGRIECSQIEETDKTVAAAVPYRINGLCKRRKE